jgi:hypothetical protein
MLPEPLLLEDKQRFVLFPIKHTDVRLSRLVDPKGAARTSRDFVPVGAPFSPPVALSPLSLTPADLGHVQEGRGIFLDGRGD